MLTYFDHRGGSLVVFGISVLVDGNGDEFHGLGIHFGAHVVVLFVRVRGRNEEGSVRMPWNFYLRRSKLSSLQKYRRSGVPRGVRRGGAAPFPKKDAVLALKTRSPHATISYNPVTRTLTSGFVMSLRIASCSLLLYEGKREAVTDAPALLVLAEEEGGPADGGDGDILSCLDREEGKKTCRNHIRDQSAEACLCVPSLLVSSLFFLLALFGL